MIIYNVTIHLEDSIEQEWVNWMLHTHLHDVMNTGMFERYEFCKMLTRQPDETGVTYVVQYIARDMTHYERYREYNLYNYMGLKQHYKMWRTHNSSFLG
jgi:hypothetical protein